MAAVEAALPGSHVLWSVACWHYNRTTCGGLTAQWFVQSTTRFDGHQKACESFTGTETWEWRAPARLMLQISEPTVSWFIELCQAGEKEGGGDRNNTADIDTVPPAGLEWDLWFIVIVFGDRQTAQKYFHSLDTFKINSSLVNTGEYTFKKNTCFKKQNFN